MIEDVGGRRSMTVIVLPTLLEEMQLPLYLREEGGFSVAIKKRRAIGELLEQ